MTSKRIIIAICVILFLVRLFIIDFCKVSGGSMASTLHDNDRVLFIRSGILFNKPKRFDIHILQLEKGLSPSNSNIIVKRLVGLPSDIVELRDTLVIVNREVVKNPKKVRFNYVISDSIMPYSKLIQSLPESTFVKHSRVYPGFIVNLSGDEREKLIRKTSLTRDMIIPIANQSPPKLACSNKSSSSKVDKENFDRKQNQIDSKIGYYYIGDNRPMSTDSRSIGPVAKKMIMGRVILILYRKADKKVALFKRLQITQIDQI